MCYHNNELSERASFKRKRNRKYLFSTPRNRDFFIMSLTKSHNNWPYLYRNRKEKIMEQVKKYEYLDETFYTSIKELLEQARKRIYRNINSEMVLTYWQIGKKIVEKQGESRADYGAGLIKELAIKLSEEYGRSFSKRNLWFMRQFFLKFRKVNAVSSQLSWTHYRLLLIALLIITKDVLTKDVLT